ncbi:MAG TPA: AMP-binding protein [Solirubrobacterales bacterium]|nr:AMP-binding protein [Solirubrobacterales bacterium]
MDLGPLATPLSLARRVKLGKLGSLPDLPFNVKTLADAGVIRPVRPDKLARVARELARWGASPAAGIAAAAITHGGDDMVIDEAGSLSFADVHRRSNALADSLAREGIRAGDGVAIMCRNHRGFIDATLAVSKLGANGLYMNTAFSGPQLVGVVERERPAALIYDGEFAGLLTDAAQEIRRFVAWREDGETIGDDPAIEDMIQAGDDSDRDAPDESSRFIILTSGTTGTPKGAQRSQPDTLSPLAAMFSKIPLHAEERTMIAAPLFHSWGFAHFMLGLALNSTYILQRRFDPERTLEATDASRATALVVVPVMMQRILHLPQETLDTYPLPDLRVTAASGSALPGPLATKWMDAFGDNLYNLYGSTEVAWATIATPEDLRAAPGTAGRPPRGTRLKIVDQEGNEVPQGETGRIFVGNEMAFEGYTGGGGKDVMDGLLSSGDVGHLDADGRLFIDGRDDEMIVSGGENVFPREVEDLLAGHEAVKEVAVIGVDDEEFGQRLKAFLVVKEDSDLDEDGAKAYVKSNLARYKVPREVEFLDSLPRNATGKVLKRELA